MCRKYSQSEKTAIILFIPTTNFMLHVRYNLHDSGQGKIIQKALRLHTCETLKDTNTA